jgi:RimJ/RimL family protein N-acetyltransferase
VDPTSERLVLRRVDRHDLDFFVDLRNHPQILALPGRQPRPRSDVERQLQRWVERWQKLGFGTWTVFDRKTRERRGRVELDPIGEGWPAIAPDEVELGCIVHPSCWNQGIATEATELALADFFDRTDRDRVVALTTSDNHPSLRALAKLALRHSGQIQREDDETIYELFELGRAEGGA